MRREDPERDGAGGSEAKVTEFGEGRDRWRRHEASMAGPWVPWERNRTREVVRESFQEEEKGEGSRGSEDGLLMAPGLGSPAAAGPTRRTGGDAGEMHSSLEGEENNFCLSI